MDNHEVFEKSEVKWGGLLEGKLNSDEEYVIDKYVKRNSKIIEGGCGGGRISFELESRQLGDIDAYDYVEDFIKKAKKNKESGVNFFVADATNLSMLGNESYDYIIYLQRLLSFIPHNQLDDSLSEAFRVLKRNGIMLCSVLNYDGRKYNKILSAVLTLIRRIRRESKTRQEIPWLKLKGKLNTQFLRKGEPTVYWFRTAEIVNKMETVGFEVLEKYIPADRPSILFLVCCKK